MAPALPAIAIGGMVATAAGGIIQGFGAGYQGQAQSNMYTYQAGVAQANQQIAAQNENWEFASGEVEAQQSGLKTEAERAGTKVAEAAGNIDVTRGTPVQVGKSITEIGQENQGIIRANAAKRAYGAAVEGFEQGAQANLDIAAAQTSRTAGDISELGSFVSTAGSVASKWMQYSTQFPNMTQTT